MSNQVIPDDLKEHILKIGEREYIKERAKGVIQVYSDISDGTESPNYETLYNITVQECMDDQVAIPKRSELNKLLVEAINELRASKTVPMSALNIEII